MDNRSRQARFAALVVALMIGGASHALAQSSAVVLYTSTEQIPLKAYAELHRSGVMQLTSGSAKDIPVIQDFRFIRCALTGWFRHRLPLLHAHRRRDDAVLPVQVQAARPIARARRLTRRHAGSIVVALSTIPPRLNTITTMSQSGR